MTRQIFYEELVSRNDIKVILQKEVEKYPNWNHEVVGYTRTVASNYGEKSSVLIKFWKEVVV